MGENEYIIEKTVCGYKILVKMPVFLKLIS